LETLETKSYSFGGSLNIGNAGSLPLLKYDYFFMTDLDSFTKDECYVKRKRKLVKERDLWRATYPDLDKIEVLTLNPSNMKLSKNPVTFVNELSEFINLKSTKTSANKTILHQVRGFDPDTAKFTGKKVEPFEFKFMRLRQEDFIQAHCAHQQKASRYRMSDPRSKKMLLSSRIYRKNYPNLSKKSRQGEDYLYQTTMVQKTELVYESVRHTVLRMVSNLYIIFNKQTRESEYFLTEYEFLTAHVFFTAFPERIDGSYSKVETQFFELAKELASSEGIST
jgi:hypothetical protein